jgi:membrane protein
MLDQPDPFGRDAKRPLHIPLRGWWQVMQRVREDSARENLSVVAAGCAFYAFFAIFPALTAVVSIYGLTADPANVERHLGILSTILPTEAYDLIIEQVRRIASTSDRSLSWGFLLSVAVAVWSVGAGTQALFAALNIAYEEAEQRSLIHFYLNAFMFALIGIAAGVVVLFAIVYVPILFASVGLSSTLELIIGIGRWPFLAVLWMLLLALLYRFGPCRRSAKWRWVTVGSVFGTVVWLAASALFSVYVAHFANYDRTYGAFGALVILLFWLYLTFYIVLLGADINAEMELQTAMDTTVGEPKPMGKRGAFVADHVAGGPGGESRPAGPVTRDPAAAKPGHE